MTRCAKSGGGQLQPLASVRVFPLFVVGKNGLEQPPPVTANVSVEEGESIRLSISEDLTPRAACKPKTNGHQTC